MLCLKVERFLCYWSLEVGGLILGWLTALGFLATFCFLGTLAFYGWFLGGVIQPNEDMWQALNMILRNNWYFFLYLIYCFGMSIAGCKLILGTRAPNHNHMKMFLLFILIGAVMSPIFASHVLETVSIVTIIIIFIVITHVYAFICVFSLHEKIRRNSSYETL